MGLTSGKSIFFVILLLSLAIASSQIPDASCSVNKGITWFLDSDSKVYTPTTGSWQDIDLSGDSDIPDDTTGVVLEIVNEDSAGNSHIGQVRAKGSSDDRTSGAHIEGTTQIMAFVKLDANKIFQAYRDNNDIKFFVRGYTGEFVVFYTDWSDVKGATSTGSQVTVTLSGVPINSIAILELYDQVDTGHAQLYFKRTGTLNLNVRYGQGGTGNAHQFIMIGCNSVSRFDYWRPNDSVNDYVRYNLVGYILPIGTPGVGFWLTSPVGNIEGSIPTDTWSDIDITTWTSSSATTALTLIQCDDFTAPGGTMKADIRKNGSSDDQYAFGAHDDSVNLPETSIFYTVGLDNNQIFEARVESADIAITLLGYTIDISAPNPPDNPLCEGQTNPTNIITFTPTFSWTFSDPDPGDAQTAYQLEVGTSAGSSDMWDSTKQTDASQSVQYGNVGPPSTALARGVLYHWRIKTWDTINLEGQYTSDQTFMINQLPIASDLKTEGLTDPLDLKTLTPTFSWTYQDPDADSQNQYEIEVGTSLDGNDMWDPPMFSGSSTSIQYSGSPLSICTVYHVRVRVHDGFEWSNDWTRETFQIRGATVETDTASGIAQFDTDIGCLTQLNAVNEETLPDVGKPELDFIHGLFSIKITNLNPGNTVNVFIRLPTSMFQDTEYWGYNPSSSTWYPIPLSDDDGDNFIIIQFIEGGLGDDDPTDGVITMIGGPGQPRLPPVAGLLMPVDKVSIVAPYLLVLLLISALTTLFSLRKRDIKIDLKKF